MREGTDILNTRHAAPVLRYVLRNDGCILQDLRDNVAGNCETILAVCARLTEAGLLTYEDVRSRPDTGKRSTHYSLTPKGRDVALLYEAMSSVIEGDGRIDPGLLDGFLEEAFRGRFRGMGRSLRYGWEAVRSCSVCSIECGSGPQRPDSRDKHRILECYSLIMELKLEGIGAVPNAEIRIDGLTVILGENGTGKSTILKALYSVAEAPVGFDDKKNQELTRAIRDMLSRQQRITGKSNKWDDVRRQVFDALNSDGPDAALSELKRTTADSEFSNSDVRDTIKVVERILSGDADSDLIDLLVERNLRDEFQILRQARNLRSDRSAEIRMTVGSDISRVTIGPDDDCRWDGPILGSFSSVLYYDTPFILDKSPALLLGGHRDDLSWALVPRPRGLVDELVSKGDVKRFKNVLKEVIDGEFKRTERGTEYVSAEGIQLNPSNLAAGAKVFAVLKLLSQNGFLNSRTLLLLDEPEVHLHPKWQNILAKLIVLLAKDMGVKVVMTTHSPQLLLAIQAFSMEYGQDVVHYLLEKKGGVIGIRDLNGDLSCVYSEMAESYEEVDDLYWKCIDQGGE